jgi:hypothetical protein
MYPSVPGEDLTSSKKLYFPSGALNAFPKIILLSCLLVLVTFIIFVYNQHWPSISLIFQLFSAMLFILIIYGGVTLVIYLIFRRHAVSLSVRGDKLLLTRKNRLEAFDLSSIDYFLIVTQIWITTGRLLIIDPSVTGFHRKEVFIVDKQAQREKIYMHESAAPFPLRKAWERTAQQLGRMTGKGVIFKYYVQDMDGQVMELDEYQKQRFRRKIKLFQNPYR